MGCRTSSRGVPFPGVAAPGRSGQGPAADGHPYFAELSHLDVTIVDLPTGHWPMWSRPQDLATELRRVADSSPTTTS
ncbi:MAG: hypothetical protein QOF39_781 [Frankiales bacterium]|nr:hypothetical protein [Frankiales bacterium]